MLFDVSFSIWYLSGALLQLCSLLCGRGLFSRALLVMGGASVCAAAAAERDLALVVGQLGILFVVWRLRCTQKNMRPREDFRRLPTGGDEKSAGRR